MHHQSLCDYLEFFTVISQLDLWHILRSFSMRLFISQICLELPLSKPQRCRFLKMGRTHKVIYT